MQGDNFSLEYIFIGMTDKIFEKLSFRFVSAFCSKLPSFQRKTGPTRRKILVPFMIIEC